MINKKLNLNNMHFDILQELGNIGAGNAITSLSKMLNKKIDMNVPNIKILDFSDISNAIGGAESPVVATLVNIHGDKINGMMMFLTEYHCSHFLINVLLNKESNIEAELDEMELSALTEIGNILTSSYLNALSDLLNTKINSSISYLSIDMAGAILSVPAIEFGKVGDKVLFIESVFQSNNMDVSGYFILVPDLQSFETLLSMLAFK